MSDKIASYVNQMHFSEMDDINDISMMPSISKNENNTVRLDANHFTKTLQFTDPNVYLGSTPITSNLKRFSKYISLASLRNSPCNSISTSTCLIRQTWNFVRKQGIPYGFHNASIERSDKQILSRLFCILRWQAFEVTFALNCQ